MSFLRARGRGVCCWCGFAYAPGDMLRAWQGEWAHRQCAARAYALVQAMREAVGDGRPALTDPVRRAMKAAIDA